MEPDSIDPHAHNFGGNKNLMPNLAVSWRLIDDLTWEFGLRDKVTFSDGTNIAFRDAAVIPVHHQLNVEATGPRVRHVPGLDGHVLAADILAADKGE